VSSHELPELMLTIPETAAVMKISKSFAKKLIAAGTVPSVLVGRCRRVRLSDLEAHIAALPAARNDAPAA
jgi:excisionase family DNA binding protein